MERNACKVPLLSADRARYGNAEYDKHLFEQYKLYVEMADRISARRAIANSFFVGVHAALVTAFTVLLKEGILARSSVGYTPFLAVLLLCYVWWRIVKSYRQLNSGKFKVIHAIEDLLPIAPYAAEWKALGEGKEASLYTPLTHIENWVPILFAMLYVMLGVAVWLQ